MNICLIFWRNDVFFLRCDPFGIDFRESLDSRDALGKVLAELMEDLTWEVPPFAFGNAADSMGFSSLVGLVTSPASEVCGTALGGTAS